MNKIYTKRRTDKMAISMLITLVVGVLAIGVYIVETSRWAQATEDIAKTCVEKTDQNKTHIIHLEEQEAENRRFQGQVKAQLDSIEDGQDRQEGMIMQLIINSNKILNGNGGSNE
jgi:predicted PurR-regulated permease PerM